MSANYATLKTLENHKRSPENPELLFCTGTRLPRDPSSFPRPRVTSVVIQKIFIGKIGRQI